MTGKGEVTAMHDDNERVAVITGASSGIGMATALKFAEEGYNVVLTARRLKELVKVGQQCEEQGVRAIVLALDVTDDQSIHKLRDEAVKAFGHINVWVNNAGVLLIGKFQEVPVEDMRRVMDTNFFGTVHGSHAALQQFRSQGFGTLINVSSIDAAAPHPYASIYSASKAAVRALGESLRMELRLEGFYKSIHVCTVLPFAVDTNIFQNAANYTGQQVRALEPAYDTQYTAKRILNLARHPRRKIIIGPAGRMMALQNAHSPRMYERQIGSFVEKDMLTKESINPNPGNLYKSIPENTGMYGGWREHRMRADRLNAGLGIGLLTATLATAGYILFRQRSHN